jgi:hypothetical protein
MSRVVVASRHNNKAEWEICYICQEADHAPFMAQEIKNQEGKSLIVGYCDEEDFFNGKLNKMKVVKEGGTLPAPESSIKKFKEYPLDYPKVKFTPPKPIPAPVPTPFQKAEPTKTEASKEKVPEKLKDIKAIPAKPTSELGKFM